MNRTIFAITLLVIVSITYAQNDTLYLDKQYVILRGKKYNQCDSLGRKFGPWLSYGLKESRHQFVEWDGHLWGGSDVISTKYRPLETGEYCGIRKVIYEKIDSVKGYKECRYELIYNKIPKDSYYLKSEGYYKNDKKIGEWKYYHENNAISRIIIYDNNAIPAQSFELFYKDGSLMMKFTKLLRGKWELIRYSKTGSELMTEQVNLEDFKEIY